MQNKSINFSGMNVYTGIDVHKKSWSVTILTDEIEHKTFTQPPCPDKLSAYLKKYFPQASYHSAYEAGFSGYGHHRKLLELGINNLVINPADVPTTGKEKAGKTDRIDSRKIAKGLRNGDLKGIYIFTPEHQELRSFARMRHILQKDFRRSKQRIKMYLLQNTIRTPEEYDNENWSIAFERWLEQLRFKTDKGKQTLSYLLKSYHFNKQQVRKISNELRAFFRKHYKEEYYLLRSIPGIGPLSSIAIITEVGDINRFKNIRQLNSFTGLLPLIYSTGETEKVGGMSYRCNRYLRSILVEASWQAVRKDPAMLLYYKKHAANGNGKKAIIKVARKLLNRVRYVLTNRTPYSTGIVQ